MSLPIRASSPSTSRCFLAVTKACKVARRHPPPPVGVNCRQCAQTNVAVGGHVVHAQLLGRLLERDRFADLSCQLRSLVHDDDDLAVKYRIDAPEDAIVDRLEYLALMAGCLLITLPLELLLGAHVYRRPRRLLRTVAAPVLVFYVWDVVAIHRDVWWFAERFTSGVVLPARVPLEELVFFVVIPICGLLTFEAVERMTGRRNG
jgi:lycopene beta-cyclase